MNTKQDRYRTLIEQTEATRFQPNESGNPAGRPKNSVTALLKNTDAKTTTEIAKTITRKAIAGDSQYTNIYLDRTDGKVPDIKKVQGLIVTITGDDMAKLSQQIRDAETELLED